MECQRLGPQQDLCTAGGPAGSWASIQRFPNDVAVQGPSGVPGANSDAQALPWREAWEAWGWPASFVDGFDLASPATPGDLDGLQGQYWGQRPGMPPSPRSSPPSTSMLLK